MKPSISTTGGDKGTTGLSNGDRVSKASLILHAYGTVDEINSIVGIVLTEVVPQELQTQLVHIQNDLFVLGADLANPILDTSTDMMRIVEADIKRVEQWGKGIETSLPVLQNFILPGGCTASAHLHMARTVCRRAERYMVEVGESASLNVHAMVYINRLSDYFFLAARLANKHANTPETLWQAELRAKISSVVSSVEQAKNSSPLDSKEE